VVFLFLIVVQHGVSLDVRM